MIVIINMIKRIIVRLGVFAALCGVVSCGNMFKPSTNLGQQIVNDVDPDLTDLNRNIKALSDSLKDSSFSMRDVGDTFPPGYQWNPAFLAAGSFTGLVSGGKETIISYLEFRPGVFRTTSSIYTSLQAVSIDSVVLRLRRLRVTTRSNLTPGSIAHIDVDTCPVLRGDSSSLLLRRTDSIPFPNVLLPNPIGTFSINNDSSVYDSTMGGDTALSIKLDSATYLTRFKNAVKDSGFDTTAFAFCLAPHGNGDGLARFMNINGDQTEPKLVVYYHTSAADTAMRTQTLYRDHAAYTAIESDSALACGSSMSSWETVRRAVFKIDVSPLSTFMDTAGPDSEKYFVIQKADLSVHVLKSISDMRLDSINVKYKLFDTLATNTYNFSGSIGSFFIRDSIGTNSNDTTYVLSLASMLQPLVVNHKSKYVYLFLMVPNQNSPSGYGPPCVQIDWKPDAKIKLSAIVTNPR